MKGFCFCFVWDFKKIRLNSIRFYGNNVATKGTLAMGKLKEGKPQVSLRI